MTIFKLEYNRNIDHSRHKQKYEYSPSLDNEISVITDICDIFHSSREVKFLVFNIATNSLEEMSIIFDLATVFSQIVEMLSNWENSKWNTEIDFFEQGTDLTYQFIEIDDNFLELKVLNFLTRQNLGNIKIAKNDAILSVANFIKDFMKIGKTLSPSLIKEPILTTWLESLEKNNSDPQ